MTPEEKQQIIAELLSNGRDVTGLDAAQSLDGILTFPAIQTTTSGGTTTKTLVSVPVSLLTQAINAAISNAENATTSARNAAAGWAVAATKMGSDIDVIAGDITILQDADKSLSTLTSYAECSTGADTASKAVTIENFALPTKGGCLHIKMAYANTVASNVKLNINATGAKDLYYNGSAVSALNTWEDNEVIEVYYDGTRYQASNTQGGGGRAAKTSFDNTVKDKYISDNMQGVIDEISDEIDDVVDEVENNTTAISTINNTTIPALQDDIDATTSVYNVTKNHPLQSGNYTLATALAVVPSSIQRVGLIITYKTSTKWETKQFIGSNISGWSTITNWTDFGGGSDDFVEVTSTEVASMDDPE